MTKENFLSKLFICVSMKKIENIATIIDIKFISFIRELYNFIKENLSLLRSLSFGEPIFNLFINLPNC